MAQPKSIEENKKRGRYGGRPLRLVNRKQVTFAVSEEMRDELDRVAKDLGLDRASLLRNMISQFLPKVIEEGLLIRPLPRIEPSQNNGR